MARAQNSYMAGSTSPSSLIQTACFFLSSGTIAVFAESTTVVVSANANAAKKAKKRNSFVNTFILSMYKDLFCSETIFCEKKHDYAESSVKNAIF